MNMGMEALWSEIIEYKNFTEKNGYFNQRRKEQSLYWMNETIQENLRSRLNRDERIREKLNQLRQEVLDEKTSSFSAAQQIIDLYFRK
jgi:LAO/AO transport system kinase